ncbi:MAG: hypothetical protein F3745_03705 [Nitrospinae bacterium]|nr:hypothetical protein [Nitrospinota bacterium]
MKKNITIFLILFSLISCSSGPEVIPGKGAVYGTITAESHKDIIAKASKSGGGIYGDDGKVVFNEKMVNYDKLKELFVCLLDPSFSGGNDHLLIANNKRMSQKSLALAKGDRLSVQNNSSQTLTFFIAGGDDDIQVFSPVKPGQRSVITVQMVGDLELGSDENESLTTTLLSRRGLVGQQHSSGDKYSFEKLNPGQYKILFWFWRLGFIEKTIFIKAGENIRINQTLSVDKIMQSKNET